jgi:hypothetical protein
MSFPPGSVPLKQWPAKAARGFNGSADFPGSAAGVAAGPKRQSAKRRIVAFMGAFLWGRLRDVVLVRSAE